MERWHGTITTSRRNRVCSAYNNGVLLQNMSKARSVLCSCAMSYSNGENGMRITLGFSTTWLGLGLGLGLGLWSGLGWYRPSVAIPETFDAEAEGRCVA